MLKAGMAAGFGSVFGTPFAGIIFAIEVTRFKSLTINSLLICFISSLTGDLTTRLWGIKHTLYAIQPLSDSKGILSALNIDSTLIYKVAIAGIAFGLASYLFIKLHSEFENLASRLISINWLKPIIGGLIIILLSYFFGSDYLGLGVVGQNKESISIVSAFQLGGAESFSWLLKLIFTAVTLSFGFKGGEVTPLFFIGATLGNTLAVALGVPIDGATKTPFTSTVMAIELFGIEYVIYFLLVNLIATYASGSHGIYSFSKTTK
jgi:H+/Cl- antiporter ClcA